jgi:hypothetical protein
MNIQLPCRLIRLRSAGRVKRPPAPEPALSWRGRRGFGLNEVIGIAAGIIIAALVIIPGLRTFAGSLLESLSDWWESMAGSIFSAT